MSNIINVYILFGMREQMAIVELCVSPVRHKSKHLEFLWLADLE